MVKPSWGILLCILMSHVLVLRIGSLLAKQQKLCSPLILAPVTINCVLIRTLLPTK